MSSAFEDQVRIDHLAIRRARRQQRFARRRRWFLGWLLGWYLLFVLLFLIMIPV